MYKEKTIIGLLTARAGSKRIIDKNIQEVGGIPLIGRSAQHAQHELIDEIYLSSDSDEYLEIGEKYGAQPLKRPEEYAGDKATHTDLLRYTARELGDFDVLVLFQPTTPFRSEETITRAIKQFIDNWDSYDSAIPVRLFQEKIGTVVDGLYKPGTGLDVRSQDVKTYVECGTLFFYKQEWLMTETGSIYGDRIMPLEIHDFKETLDIDGQEELELAQLLAQ